MARLKRKSKVNPYSLGGIAMSAGAGVAGGAAGGPVGMIAGGAIGLAKGIFGHVAEEKAAEVAAIQENLAQVAATQTKLSSMTSKGGKLLNAAGQEINPFNKNAYGGFNKTRDLEEYNVGGSHEQNPNGGIQVGIGENGKPNTVEEGEAAFDDFVYSNRIPYQKTDTLPGFVKGDTVADAAKSIKKAFANRNDKYSKDTEKELYGRLAKWQEQRKQEMDIGQKEDTLQGQNQFTGGGFPESVFNFDKDAIGNTAFPENKFITPEGVPGIRESMAANTAVTEGVTEEGSTKDQTWLERNKDTLQTGALIVGVGSQLAGVASNIRAKNRLEKSPPVVAETLDPNQISPHLVNKGEILTQIGRGQQSAINALGARASGNFGAFAANVAGIQGKTAEATSTAMLQAEQMDAAELARVEESRAGINQFNAKMRMAATEATAQDTAAYEGQRGRYERDTVRNIGSLGQSLINYVTGTKFAEYEGKAAEAEALSEDPYRYSKRRNS